MKAIVQETYGSADVLELRMSVDEALKYVISMGVVAPPMRNPVGRAQNQ